MTAETPHGYTICDKCLVLYKSVRLGDIANTGCPLCMVIDRCDLLTDQIGALEDKPTDFRGARITIHQTFGDADPDAIAQRMLRDIQEGGRVQRPPAHADPFVASVLMDEAIAEHEDRVDAGRATGADLDALVAQRGLRRMPGETDGHLRDRVASLEGIRNGTRSGSLAAIRDAIGRALPERWTFSLGEPLPEKPGDVLHVFVHPPGDMWKSTDAYATQAAVEDAILGVRPVGQAIDVKIRQLGVGTGPYRSPTPPISEVERLRERCEQLEGALALARSAEADARNLAAETITAMRELLEKLGGRA